MKILAIDTSTEDSSVVVLDDNRVIGEFTVNQKRTHSETLIPIVSNLLEYLGLSINDIDLFAAGIGPGSFTGIRIGLTVVKTLAQISGKDIVGVSTLEALAYSCQADLVLPILDARGGRVYYSLFDKDLKRLEEDKLIYAEDLRDLIKDYDKLTVIGDYDEEIKSALAGDNVVFARSILNNTIARGVAACAKSRYEAGIKDDYLSLKANYVRKSQAERDLKC